MLKMLVIAPILASAVTIGLMLVTFDGPGSAPVAQAGAGDVTLLAIDAIIDDDGDTTPDNDDSTVGTIDDCDELANVGDQTTFDLVVQGVDPTDRIANYQVDIDYDPAVLKIVGIVQVDAGGSVAPDNVSMISRILSASGAGFLSLSDAVPDTDGSYTTAAADGTALNLKTLTGPPAMHEPASTTNGVDDDNDGVIDDAGEGSEDGVLARITVEAVGVGTSPILVPAPSGGSDGVVQTKITAGTGPLAGNPIPVEAFAVAAISVGEACVPPVVGPNVAITNLDCTTDNLAVSEIVRIENSGTEAQDLTGWELRSDPVGSQVLDLGATIGSLDVSGVAEIWSHTGAGGAQPANDQYPWDTNEKFRDGDPTDFAQLVDTTQVPEVVVDQENCIFIAFTPTPTPTIPPGVVETPTVTASPTASPSGSPAPAAAPPTGDGFATSGGGGSAWPWLLAGLGAAIVVAAAGYVIHALRKGRLTH